ncbi:glutamate--cysteine ligase [Buchnera aphidicola]|uniref:Glutamate--cysteine ligase n=1 Tax=Buchnera aphidicola (Aphis gossypii) TaxID=98785 RepID=A0A5J6ZDS2_9GAMM|nr:glutamate--cysteine ligase [Buchnera aphidicola]QFQ32223.1 glutamate--cysteine ligase [Buchnera aphidicola (Aphis gossypii)]UPT14749.1 glutamate--cysteine ligase [Buchnera aphidicola (Aphis gossypii)]
MIEDISREITWLEKNSSILKNIYRGIERETLRIKKNGDFSNTQHPYKIGSSLTHQWITTDFSENLLEFVTPKTNNINYLLHFLTDLHSFVAHKNPEEFMWPFSIPYNYKKSTNIQIAKYGTSNYGAFKTLYRKGLKIRYGDLKNTISGIHYNFSLPKNFWKKTKTNQIDNASSGYLNLIRNYYRFGWIIPYLFGASPAISKHFLRNKNYEFQRNKEGILYLPWSTSLRISDIGHTSTSIEKLNITFNDLESYIKCLKEAMHTPSKKFSNLGLTDKFGELQQLNTNILQLENELYTQIRPKTKTQRGESLLDALKNRGIEYVEIRSLDINPFSSIGINKNQILLLDLFLIWCSLVNAPKIKKADFYFITENWKKTAFEGRKPNQKIYIDANKNYKLTQIGKRIFQDLKKIAIILDRQLITSEYQEACDKKILFFEHPELTYSAKFLELFIKNKKTKKIALNLAHKYHHKFMHQYFYNSHNKIFENETINSHKKQIQIENNESLSLKDYLNK